jgi:hypothetical protein
LMFSLRGYLKPLIRHHYFLKWSLGLSLRST